MSNPRIPHGVNGHVPPAGNVEPVPGAANMLMGCFLAALSMLFAASIVLYFVVRHIAPQWPPLGAPELPRTLWFSTVVILASSVTIQSALAAIRRGNTGALQAWLSGTLLLAAVFIASQLSGWHTLTAIEMSQPVRQFVATFMILTVLHALHVIGGVVPLVVCTVRAGQGLYSADQHQGVTSLTRYWHFLGIVWLILFAVIELAQHK